MKRRHASAAVAAAVLLSTACSTPAADPGTTQASGPATGGEIVQVLAALGNSWQQQEVYTWYQSQVWVNLTETLVFVSSDGEVEPWLASGWEISEDGLQYTFDIREGVTFSDGNELTPQVVADNLNLLGKGDESRGLARVAGFPSGYESAAVTQDGRVLVTLSHPDSGFLPTLGYQSAGILSPDTISLSKEEQSDLGNVSGTGPFVVESVVPDKEVVLVRRDGYAWPRDGALHDGEAYLDRIVFRIVPEEGVRLGALESGQADVLFGIQPTEEEGLTEAGFTVVTGSYLGGTHGLEVRQTAPFVDDVRVRQAIQHGIDREAIIDTIYSSNWTPARSVLQSSVPGWVDLSELIEYDPDASNTLLDEAGWTARDDAGYRTKDGQRLQLLAYPSLIIPTSANSLQIISQQLKEIGVELRIEQADSSTYTTLTQSDEVPLVESRYTLLDASYLRSWYHSAASDRLRAEDQELDGLLDELAASSSDAEKFETAERVQRYLLEQAYFIPLEEAVSVFVTAGSVQDLQLTGTGRPIYYDVWFDE